MPYKARDMKVTEQCKRNSAITGTSSVMRGVDQAVQGLLEPVGIFIPKEQNSTAISQFRSIALLNMEEKVLFTVLAKRIAHFLIDNSYIDTTCIVTIIAKYFTTGWQQFEVGIAMGCSISPILFVVAFEVILIGVRQVARGLNTRRRKTPRTDEDKTFEVPEPLNQKRGER
ncbi:hypothetical protein SRHO_G00041710 [Serrasalmus rhombeus]